VQTAVLLAPAAASLLLSSFTKACSWSSTPQHLAGLIAQTWKDQKEQQTYCNLDVAGVHATVCGPEHFENVEQHLLNPTSDQQQEQQPPCYQQQGQRQHSNEPGSPLVSDSDHQERLPCWLAELDGLTATDVLLLACLRPGLSPHEEETLAQLMAGAILQSRCVRSTCASCSCHSRCRHCSLAEKGH
jgi:hypothetical protein